ncbi:MAG: Ig-like domain-containing protein, partial [candidate division Zixibacteria bacterium]|nr:Ig-like domain-containing protein [candidate division Zixibacteria bacterium]
MFACNGGPNDPDGDTTPPQIVSVSPAEDAVEVAVDAVIRVVFSEAIDTNKITAATFTIGPAVAGSFHFDSDTVTFAPTAELDYSATYNVSVTTGVTDLAGNRMAANKSWSFETAGNPATTPPQVIATIPANGAGDVVATAAISATFSKAIDAATLTALSFTVSGVTGTISYADSTATFTPDDTLEFNTVYTATLDTMVVDTFGNHLATPYVWSFTTGDDPMIPIVFIVSPDDSVIIGDTVTIKVLAGPVAITRVEFYLDGMHIPAADVDTEPYEFFWDASAETIGSQHSIHARAYEAGGRVGFSDPITLFCQWEELVTDANDLWATDIKRVLARSTDTTIEFRYEFWEPWFDPYDT